jgi:hypothetical protein
MIDWSVEAVNFGNCSCDYGCPCPFELRAPSRLGASSAGTLARSLAMGSPMLSSALSQAALKSMRRRGRGARSLGPLHGP